MSATGPRTARVMSAWPSTSPSLVVSSAPPLWGQPRRTSPSWRSLETPSAHHDAARTRSTNRTQEHSSCAPGSLSPTCWLGTANCTIATVNGNASDVTVFSDLSTVSGTVSAAPDPSVEDSGRQLPRESGRRPRGRVAVPVPRLSLVQEPSLRAGWTWEAPRAWVGRAMVSRWC